jgi:hypothetical protein
LKLIIFSGFFFSSRCDSCRVAFEPGLDAFGAFSTLVLKATVLIWWKSRNVSVTTIAHVRISGTKTVSEMITVLAVTICIPQVVSTLGPYGVAVADRKFIQNAEPTDRAGASGLSE